MAGSSCNELDCTLEDDAWKDSFDKLLDVKPVLRELNLIKKDVRASFNIDSSIENSKDLSQFLAVPKAAPKKANNIISTPVGKLPKQPFKCSISPITQWKFQFFEANKKKQTPKKLRKLQSTVVEPLVVEIDYDDAKNKTKEAPVQTAAKDNSLSEFLKRAKRNSKKVPAIRQVLFDSNVKRKSTRISVEQPAAQPERTTKSDERRTSRKRSSQEKTKRKSTNNMTLQPGKWRKSLSCLRRSQIMQAQTRRSSQRNVCRLEVIEDEDSVQLIDVIPASKFVGERKTIFIKTEHIEDISQDPIIDHKEHVLQYCNQLEPAQFNELYAKEAMPDCKKIGEGVYGEVFLKKINGESIVCKIIPIEGTQLINGEVQKTFEQILPEIVISKELSKLRETTANNVTCGFVETKKVNCVKGKYPEHLIENWDVFDNEKGSENDHPGDFLDEQLYIVLELEFAGQDLETFVFNNAEQSYSALKQIVFTLAVAEEAFEFEHRDLHWGNVLIRPTDDTEFKYKLSGSIMTLPAMGIKVTIIDYTLSRMKFKSHCFYNDLTNDEELFTATGDYQFDIYRMMRDVLGQNWERYEPKTNIYWISYILAKMTNGVKYKNKTSKGHTQCLRKMRSLKNNVLEFSSASDLAKHLVDV